LCPILGSALPQEKVLSILEHIAEGCGVRETSRLVGMHRGTVMRYSRLAGEHARKVHDELVAFPPNTREVQFDAKWSFVGKKEKHCDAADPNDAKQGDNWGIHGAVTYHEGGGKITGAKNMPYFQGPIDRTLKTRWTPDTR